MPERYAVDLERVLRIPYAMEFITSLAELDPDHSRRPHRTRPWPLGIFWTLDRLYYVAENSGGLGAYLGDEEADIRYAREGCVAVGAALAVEYIDSVALLFPNGRVPESIFERLTIMENIRLQKSPLEQFDELGQLRERYNDAMEEMVTAVRQFVRSHIHAIVAALDRSASAMSMTQEGDVGQSGSAEDASSRRRANLSQSAATDALRQLLGGEVSPLDGTEDPVVRQLCDDLVQLRVDDWLAVGKRYASDPLSVNRAIDFAERIPYQKLYPSGVFSERVHAVVAVTRRPLLARLNELPDTVNDQGVTFPLKRVAREAAMRAVFVVSRRSWLTTLLEGRASLRILLTPFVGFVPIPVSFDW